MIETISHVSPASLSLSGHLIFKKHVSSTVAYTVLFTESSEKHLDLEVKLFNVDKDHRVILTFASHPEEDFYSFSEQFSYSTLKGQKVPIFLREQGVGRGAEPVTSILNDPYSVFGEFAGGDSFTTYCAVPQYISTDNKAFFLKDSEYSSFDLRYSNKVVVRLNSTTLNGHFIDGDKLLDVLSEYTLYSGRMQKLPDWISEGAVVGIQGGQDKVRRVIKQLQALDTPIAAVWLQDWCGKRLHRAANGVEFKRLWGTGRVTMFFIQIRTLL